MYVGQLGQQTPLAQYPGDNQAKRIAELPAAMDNMERGISFTQDCLNELATRLEGLLRPPAPEPQEVGQTISPAPPMSGYASSLHRQASDVTRIGDRIQDLLRRLEV